MGRIDWRRLAGRVAAAAQIAVAAVGAVPEPVGAQPSAADIIKKVQATSARAPRIVAGNVSLELRVNKPLTAAPDCAYAGSVQPTSSGYAVKVERETARAGLVCTLVSNGGMGKLLEFSEPVSNLLQRFDFSVRGQKAVGEGLQRGRFFLLDGKAKSPNNDPSAISGWVDYDKGLWDEGTITYSWGEVDTKQKYAFMQNAWVLSYQYLYSKRFGASLEVVYSDLRFAR